MRFLIGLYIAFGVAEIMFASALGFRAIHLFGHPNAAMARLGADALIIAVLALFASLLPFLVAYGLFKRWRIIRLLLLVFSLWTTAVCLFAIGVEAAKFAGLTDGRFFGVNDPPAVTFAIAGGGIAAAGLHWWILMRPAVRASFQPIDPNTTTPADPPSTNFRA